MTPFIIGIAGGSGSGKTTVAQIVRHSLKDNCAILYQDSYYKDQSHKFDRDGGAVNFDHPSSIDFKLMEKHLKAIKNGENIEMPFYDFATHTRAKETTRFEIRPIIFLDGILIFSQPAIQDCLDYKVFVSATEEHRFQRRLKRDVETRGRTEQGVRDQFFGQVAPMHNKFVEPHQREADLVLINDGELSVLENSTQKLVSFCREKLSL